MDTITSSIKNTSTPAKQSGNFSFQSTPIAGVYVITPKTFGDDRGYFLESYSEKDFKAAGLNYDFVQDNQSSSKKGVLRGLHFQKTHPQAKLVRVLSGEVFDVAIDLREGSATYGEWVGARLSAENKKQLMIPRGFAHGFLVLSDMAEFAYKCDEFYHPEDEGGLLYNDSDVNIEWPAIDVEYTLSEKDKVHPTLKNLNFKFKMEA